MGHDILIRWTPALNNTQLLRSRFDIEYVGTCKIYHLRVGFFEIYIVPLSTVMTSAKPSLCASGYDAICRSTLGDWGRIRRQPWAKRTERCHCGSIVTCVVDVHWFGGVKARWYFFRRRRGSAKNARTLSPQNNIRRTPQRKHVTANHASIATIDNESREERHFNHAAAKETRKSRKQLLQCWCSGQVRASAYRNHAPNSLAIRKTGITLPDRGVYDEHGLEPVSGIFSSPEKSPPKRSGTVTASESMEIQESMLLENQQPPIIVYVSDNALS